MIEIRKNRIVYSGKDYSVKNFIHQIKVGIEDSFIESSPICFCVGTGDYEKYLEISKSISSAFEERDSGIRKCLNLNNYLN